METFEYCTVELWMEDVNTLLTKLEPLAENDPNLDRILSAFDFTSHDKEDKPPMYMRGDQK